MAIRHGRHRRRAKPCSPPCLTISTNRPPRSSRKAPSSTDRLRSRERTEMKAAGAVRWTVAVVAAMLAGALSFRADAQSEYMRGDRMPYDAFDRLPRTDLAVP